MKRTKRFRCALLLVSAACVMGSGASAQTISNGGFEAGLTGWTTADFVGSDGTFFSQSGTSSPLNGFTVPAPPQGTSAAMTDQGAGGAHILYQDFVVPVGPISGTANFSLFLNSGAAFVRPATLNWSAANSAGGQNLNQQARVDILTTSADLFSVAAGDVLQNLYSTAPNDPTTAGYFDVSQDITSTLLAHQGQTLRLRFAEVDNVSFFNLGVDSVGITVVPEPSTVSQALALAIVGGMGVIGLRRRWK